MSTVTQLRSSFPSLPHLVFDEDGFLVNTQAWTPEVSQQIAELDDIAPLTPAHWSIISFLRDYHLRFGALPPLRTVCRASGVSRETVKTLFGSCREVWRVAGLPNPGEEAKAYMD